MKAIVTLQDDVDGTEAVETIHFGCDGVDYEIDLSARNAELLREAIAPYSDAARRTRGHRAPARARPAPRKPPTSESITMDDRANIQRFVTRTGEFRVPANRGPIAAEIVQAWRDAGSPRKKVTKRSSPV